MLGVLIIFPNSCIIEAFFYNILVKVEKKKYLFHPASIPI